MVSILARVVEALRTFGRRPADSWVRPSNAVTRWLNGTLEAPEPVAADHERADVRRAGNDKVEGNGRPASASDAA